MLPEARPATADEWDVAWASDPTATFFQSRAWADAWSAATNGRMRPAAMRVEAGERTAVIPITLDARAGGLASIARLSPASTWGGALAAPDGEAARLASYGYVLDTFDSLEWVVSAFAPHPPDWLPATAHGHTSVIELVRPFEQVRAGWRKGHRSATAQGRRLGVTVDQARNS